MKLLQTGRALIIGLFVLAGGAPSSSGAVTTSAAEKATVGPAPSFQLAACKRVCIEWGTSCIRGQGCRRVCLQWVTSCTR
ncbi:MAG TPA: hypothetical protein VNK48_10260 [Xanthobacteraceae bacterium]|nr:hypothetical protein [Xanthobacteraceae bacterium]